MSVKTIISWAVRLVAVIILLQTLYFKFTASEESVYIFTTLGMEPWGRIGSGIAELIFSIMLIIPKTIWMGALGGLGVMGGAIASHLGPLGLEVQDDGGTLFFLAIITFSCCGIALVLHWKDVPLERFGLKK
jgi:hypothetical protein